MQTSISLDNNQIKALPTTIVQLLPSPGAGKIYVLLCTVVRCDFTAGAYGNIDGDTTLAISYTLNGLASAITFGFPNSGTDKLATVLPQQSIVYATGTTWERTTASVSALESGLINSGLESFMYNNGGNLTGGNPSNTMVITMIYEIINTV